MSSPSAQVIVGRYALLRRLAVGGMAEVFLAKEQGGPTGLDRMLVIKLMLPQLDAQAGFREMFLQEARLAAQINHPNVVQIIELGEDGGRPFIAMEYVDGVSLYDLLATAQEKGVMLPVGVAVGLLLQACAGAHAAHELRLPDGKPAGLVHRDLTPHNLMVTGDGWVRLLDFGVAKARTNTNQTRSGVLKGKLPYMSPEQLAEKALDRRSDVFTLGSVLWELLLGRRAFQRDSEVATIHAVLEADPPELSDSRTDVPFRLMAVALRALAKEPEDRFDNADAMRRALATCAPDRNLDTSSDAIAGFVRSVMGDTLSQQRSRARAASEQSGSSVTSYSQVRPALSEGTRAAALPMLGAAVGAVVALGLVALLGIGVFVGMNYTDGLPGMSEGQDFPTGPIEGGLQIALAPTVDEMVLREDLEPVRLYLSQELGETVSWVIPSTYEQTATLLVQGDVAFASLPPYLYVQARMEHREVQAQAVKIHGGGAGSDGVLLVPEAAGVRVAEDLRGKRICYSDRNSTTGFLLPRRWLRDQGVDPDMDFAAVRISGNHLQVLRDLVEGKCDVGGTFSDAFVAADEAGVETGRLRVFAVTGHTPHDAFCSGPHTERKLSRRLRRALVEFDPMEDAGVSQVGTVERLTGFREVDDRDYDALRRAVVVESGTQ